MSYQTFKARRVGTTLAACALAALFACSKEVGNNAEARPGVGAKLDKAIERTQQKLASAGERAKEEVAEATEKTHDTLSKAGEKISAETRTATQPTPPSSARQPGQDSLSVTATSSAEPGTTTTTLTTGPATSVKMSGVPADTRALLNDAAITASIKADVLRDPDLSVLKIDVDTKDGVVTLNGLAGNEAARDRAGRMAQSVKGVKEVRNHLTVKQG